MNFTVRVSGTDISVTPFQHWQMPAAGSGDVVADFSVVSGNARILPYGSMVDDKSGDAIYVPGRVPPQTARTEYAPAISAVGALGTRWSTEVVLANVAGGVASGVATYLGNTIVIDPVGAALRFPDMVAQAFHREQTLGLLRLNLPTGVLATARISTPSDGGSVGQFVPFTSTAHGGDLIQLEVSDNFRTNLGAANTAGEPLVIRLTAFDAEGAVLSSMLHVLDANELMQVPLAVNAARVRVDGPVLAYASVVDNRSGDAIFVPAQ